MKRTFTFILWATIGLTNTFAQTGSGYTENGYYRVKNFKSERYIYVTDNKDYSDKAHDRADFQAIQLWKDIDKTISAPASVVYIEKVGNAFDLKAQGTGVHDLTGYYVDVTKQRNGTYTFTVTSNNVTKYLTDERTSSRADGKIGVNGSGDYRTWVIDRMETNHASNYFGIKPSFELNGLHYQPFYASFPFRPVSPDMNIYYIEKIEGNNAIWKKIEGDVPGGTPVLIECTSNDPSQNRLELLTSTTAKVTGNKLSGTYFCNGDRPQGSKDAYVRFKASTMRVFSVVDGKLVLTDDDTERLSYILITDWDTDEDIYDYCIPANTSYLKVDAQTPKTLFVVFEGSGINDIKRKGSEATEGVFSISGTQLRATNDTQDLPAGLYIVGGKKVAIK